MNPEIFRQYDIRGIVDKDLTDDVVENIGKAYGTYVKDKNVKKITLGGDCRLSSDRFRNVLKKGLLSTGLHVIDLGTCPTPLLYFSIRHLKTEGGIMITGSHNPSDYNGFKLCIGPDTIHGEEIQNIRKVIEKEKFVTSEGKEESFEITPVYQDYLIKNAKVNNKNIKIVIDAGNGTGGVVAKDIFTKLGIKTECLYCEMDGNFPNHHPDPTVPENLEDLKNRVLEISADVGIGYDGDADRIGIVDDKGNIIWGDQLMILFAREILQRKPGATFISEVKCSNVMYDDIKAHGGNAIMWKTGHSLIKEKMKEMGAELAAEMSGHIFFKDRYFGFDDAIYSSLRLVEILSNSDKKISEMLSNLPKTFTTPEIRVDCPDSIKFQVVDKVRDFFKKEYEVIDVDGARILFPEGWGLVRASNTQPVLVLRFEANSIEQRDKLKKIVTDKVNEVISN